MEPLKCVGLIKPEPFSKFGSDAARPELRWAVLKWWSEHGARHGEGLWVTPGRVGARRRLHAGVLGTFLVAHSATSLPPTCPRTSPQSVQPRQQTGCWPLLKEQGKVLQETFKWDEISALHGLQNYGGGCWHQPKQEGLLGCVCHHPSFSSIPRACTHRHTGSTQTCINLHTQANTYSSPPLGGTLLYIGIFGGLQMFSN